MISLVQDDVAAIGFVLARADDDLGKHVRQLDIGDDEPEACTNANVYAGRWPLQVSICFRSSAIYPALGGIAMFCATAKGADVLASYGIWPEANAAKVLSQERLALATEGKGELVTAVGRSESEPILKAVATCFIEDKAPIQLSFRAGSVTESRKRVAEGDVDLWVAPDNDEGDGRPPEDAKDEQPRGRTVPLARHVTVVIVNRENPVQSLTVEELRDIYSGKTKEWASPVGGQTVIQRLTLPGKDGAEQIAQMMERLRKNPPGALDGVAVARDGCFRTAKVPSTPADPSVGLLACLRRLRDAGVEDVDAGRVPDGRCSGAGAVGAGRAAFGPRLDGAGGHASRRGAEPRNEVEARAAVRTREAVH